jgi:hypothetical protein
MLDQGHAARSSPEWMMAELGRGQEEHIKTQRSAHLGSDVFGKGSVRVVRGR